MYPAVMHVYLGTRTGTQVQQMFQVSSKKMLEDSASELQLKELNILAG